MQKTLLSSGGLHSNGKGLPRANLERTRSSDIWGISLRTSAGRSRKHTEHNQKLYRLSFCVTLYLPRYFHYYDFQVSSVLM